MELFNGIITISRNYEHFIIYVDIKMLNVDWNSYTSTCDQTQFFLDRMIDYNMQQEVNFKTASYGILDRLFLNSKTEVVFCKKCKDEKLNCLPNHDAILTKLKFQSFSPTFTKQDTVPKSYGYCNADFDQMNFHILNYLLKQFVEQCL